MPTAVYIIKNTITSQCYVGASICCTRRWYQHKHNWKHGRNTYNLQNAYDKYGEAAFEFDILEFCLPEDLNRKEQEWIERLNPVYNNKIEDNFLQVDRSGDHPLEGKSCPIKKTYCVDGVYRSIKDHAEYFQVNVNTVYGRLHVGWTLEKALKTPNQNTPKPKQPKQERPTYTFKGVSGTVYELCKHFKINQSTVSERLKRGWTLEDAVTTPPKGR